jgi:hypothetical protein
MALTQLQADVCRLIARHRIASGESYVAGGAALNEIIAASRLSNDVDLFHDSEEALHATWSADRRLLEEAGFDVRVLRERPSFIEADAVREGQAVRLQWVRDSVYRFFPLVEHETFGLTLHAFDLATNKLLALVGRTEARDWVDVIACDERVQPLGYLAWAACAKDPGFSPAAILEHAARSSRYSVDEIRALSFAGPTPDAGKLARDWRAALEMARDIVAALPPAETGSCVLEYSGALCRASAEDLPRLVEDSRLLFHHGRIRGAFPRVAER